jgi:hypothetical protein
VALVAKAASLAYVLSAAAAVVAELPELDLTELLGLVLIMVNLRLSAAQLVVMVSLVLDKLVWLLRELLQTSQQPAAAVAVELLLRLRLPLPAVLADKKAEHPQPKADTLPQFREEHAEQPLALARHLAYRSLRLELVQLVAAVAHTSPQSRAWPVLSVLLAVAAVAVELLPITASRQALAVLAAPARSSSSPTANP